MVFGHKSHKTWPGSSLFLFSVKSIAAFSKSLAEYIRISHPQSRHLNPYRPYPTKRGRFESVKIYMQKFYAFLVKIMLSQKRKLLGPYGCRTALPGFEAADVGRRFTSCVPVPGMLHMCTRYTTISYNIHQISIK